MAEAGRALGAAETVFGNTTTLTATRVAAEGLLKDTTAAIEIAVVPSIPYTGGVSGGGVSGVSGGGGDSDGDGSVDAPSTTTSARVSVFMPPCVSCVGASTPFTNMTESVLASYTNYRFWPEV